MENVCKIKNNKLFDYILNVFSSLQKNIVMVHIVKTFSLTYYLNFHNFIILFGKLLHYNFLIGIWHPVI